MFNFILIAAAIIIFLVIARKPRPVADRNGNSFNNSSILTKETDKQQLIVATYNVQTGKNLQGQRNIHRAAEVVKEVDIVGIQEVYAKSWMNRFGLGICQTQALSVPGVFTWLFSPTRLRWFRENRGNAILSKLPVKSWQTIALPDQTGIRFRNLTTINFEFNKCDCYFINTHLHTRQGKTEQLKVALREFDNYQTAILVGDFNLSLEHPELQKYLAKSDAVDVISTSKTISNEERIDWIITPGWKVINVTQVDKGISDHPYYQATLELK